MFRIKICGVTQVEDALAAVGSGADAIGLNFAAGSPRQLSPAAAAEIASALTGQAVVRVGVFVNAKSSEITEICQSVPLDVIQLHGDEPPDSLRDLPPLPLIKALRPRVGEEAIVRQYVDAAAAFGRPLAAALVDAHQPGQYGGTGQAIDWDLAGAIATLIPVPLILAGGLRPENVADAIRAVRPAGVDVASGVEEAPGIKSPARVRAFVAVAQAAFAATATPRPR